MAQTPKYQVPAHPSGLDMRTQINAIILSMIGDNSGPTQPAELYPGMMWGDTTAMRLKRRNNANTAWVDIGPIDNFTSEANAAAANKVNKTGDTMSGGLTMYSASVISSPIYFNANGYAPHFRGNNQPPGFEWVNAANTAVVGWLTDTGQLNVATNLSVGQTGSVYWPHSKGRMWMRGDGGIGAAGGIGFINNSGNSWRFQLTDEGYWTFYNLCLSTINVCPSLDTNGFQGTLGPGYLKLNEYTNGGYIDLSRMRSEDYRWRIMFNINNDCLYFYNKGGVFSPLFSNDGSAQFNNVWMSATGDWLSNTLNAKSPRNTQIQWASGIRELGALAPGGGDVIADGGNPWAMEGIRCTGGGATWIWPRCIWYGTP